MSASRLTTRFAIAIGLTWLVPSLISLLFFEITELPGIYGQLGDLGWLAYGYAALSAPVAMLVLTRMMVVEVIRRSGAPEPAARFRGIRRLAAATVVAVLLHLLVGALVVAVDGGIVHQVSPGVLMLTPGLLGTLALVMLTPLYVYCQGLFGVRFGADLTREAVTPMSIRMVAVGMGVCLVAAVFPIIYNLVVTGLVLPDLLLIAGVQVAYATLVTWLAYRSQRESLAPLHRLLRLHDDRDRAGIARVEPRSLDEIGVLSRLLKDLLLARLDHERELDISQSRTRMFAEAASDYLYEIDEELNFTFISERFEALTGIPTALLVGQSVMDMGQGYMSPERQRHLEDLRAHRPYRNYRFSVAGRDGRVIHLQISALPVFEDGRFRGYRGAGTDITAFVESQQQLIETETELAEAHRMEGVAQLTGGVAHHFNNALATIMGNLELVLAQGRLSEQQQRYAGAALEAAQRNAHMVQRLLAFSRSQALDPAPTDMGRLLDDLEESLVAVLGPEVDLSLSMEQPAPTCLADRAQLRQALMNLALNARDAMPEGGRLVLRVDRQDAAHDDRSVPEPGRYVRILVRDTGVGIAEDQRHQVFEPFFTTKAPGSGSGLGLSMVYGFVQQSGGRVAIGNNAGGGAWVEMLLPAAAAHGGAAGEFDGEAIAAISAAEKLLVVEDDPGLRRVMSHSLRDQGYQVEAVGQGEEAVMLLDRRPDLDLVICDLALSGSLSGLDVTRHLSRTGHRARALLMTGYSRAEVAGGGLLEEAPEMLQKPFGMRQLAERVAALLGRQAPAGARRAG